MIRYTLINPMCCESTGAYSVCSMAYYYHEKIRGLQKRRQTLKPPFYSLAFVFGGGGYSATFFLEELIQKESTFFWHLLQII